MALVIKNPYAVPGEYRKAQLHCHTTESDGRFRPAELLRMYKEAGYSFVCITDHNLVTRFDDLDDSQYLAIPGTEDTVSRYLPPLGPHMGRLFVDEPLREGSAQDRIDRTLAAGGVVSLCHPSWTGNLWTGDWSEEAVRTLKGYQLLEIWNPHSNSETDLQRWTAALRARGPESPVWGVAVDDCHHRGQFNRGWIMVKVPEISTEALRRSLLNGSFYASTGVYAEFGVETGEIYAKILNPPLPREGRTVSVAQAVPSPLGGEGKGEGAYPFQPTTNDRLPPTVTVRFVAMSGRMLAEAPGPRARYTVKGNEGFVRVECHGPGGNAWSQPFWIEVAAS